MKNQFPALRSRSKKTSHSALRVALTYDAPRTIGASESDDQYAESVEDIARSLEALGHRVEVIDVGMPIGSLVDRLTDPAPDLIFNTAQGVRGRSREAFYPLLFEQLGIPFTGSDAHVCTVALDKSLAKHVLSAYGVPVAMSKLIEQPQDLDGHELRFPLVLKPNYGGSAFGTKLFSIVANPAELRVRAIEMLETFSGGVLLEEYIDGVDVSVPFLEAGTASGNGGVLEPARHVHTRPGNGTAARLSDDGHGTGAYFDSHSAESRELLGVSAAQRVHVMHVSRVVLEALQIRDLARIDYRVDRRGGLYFLQVDVIPRLDVRAPMFAGQGMGHPTLIDVVDAVVRSASRRYGLGEHRRVPSRPTHRMSRGSATGL
jgi:D-alanine-D-alanine ligase